MTPLESSGLPLFFKIRDPEGLGLAAPAPRRGIAVRTSVGSLSDMQKEAVVVSSVGGDAWRLASDEGPYLNGADIGPCPLSMLTTGMVAATMNEILALARQRNIKIRDLRLIQDNFYTMEGSALRGTMVGGALPVELEAQIDADADRETLRHLLYEAVAASPLTGLMRGRHTSRFTLTANGRQLPLGRVAKVDGPAPADPTDRFALARPLDSVASEPIRRIMQVEVVHGVAGGAASSLKSEQSRQLHVRGTCVLRPDGVKEITQELFSPIGSTFRFLSDEPPRFGGEGRAPDSASYISAGIGFCFMTQLGRYATILKKDLSNCRVVQDTHFSLGGASGGTGEAGSADPVETHVFLTTREDDDFARAVLDMGEQTCFLHAFCRTDLKTRIKLRDLAPA